MTTRATGRNRNTASPAALKIASVAALMIACAAAAPAGAAGKSGGAVKAPPSNSAAFTTQSKIDRNRYIATYNTFRSPKKAYDNSRCQGSDAPRGCYPR